MQSAVYKSIICLVLLISTGCAASHNGDSSAISPLPSGEPVRIIEIYSALAPIQAAVWLCADQSQITNLVINDQPVPGMETQIKINYFDRETLGAVYQIAWDRIIFAAGDQKLAQELSQNEVLTLFQRTPEQAADSEEIYAWLYPDGHPLRELIQEARSLQQISPNVRIAPGLDEMVSVLSQESNSLGILPEAWLTKEIYPIESIDPAIQIPIIAELLVDDPLNQRLLACLQSSTGQQLLAEDYLPLTPIQ